MESALGPHLKQDGPGRAWSALAHVYLRRAEQHQAGQCMAAPRQCRPLAGLPAAKKGISGHIQRVWPTRSWSIPAGPVGAAGRTFCVQRRRAEWCGATAVWVPGRNGNRCLLWAAGQPCLFTHVCAAPRRPPLTAHQCWPAAVALTPALTAGMLPLGGPEPPFAVAPAAPLASLARSALPIAKNSSCKIALAKRGDRT